ncbi:MAG: amino acid ABC transporter permease [Dermatophilaceae bacterium]|nr:amino acid ABC transporter permease [Dermatophilaceae bacterium]
MSTPSTTDRPGLIEARPVRHPWRWVAIAVIGLLAAMLANMVFTNPAWDWGFVFKAMIQTPVLRGLYIGTLLTTVLAMAVGIVGGVLTAVMRLSDNPILSAVAWVFTWFFRGIPRYVLLFTMGALGVLFQQGLGLGIPFDWKIQQLLGISGSWRFATLDANALFSGLFGAVLGLGLSEAAYMSEIARAGILSVDKGQAEAAEALGMSSGKSMLRIVLPQAMRVIVPPTGNETIAMVKDTSLLIALPLSTELFFQLSAIGSRTYKVFPAAVAASLWYLAITSILMVGQYYLERHFGRGFGQKKPKDKRFARAGGMGGA